MYMFAKLTKPWRSKTSGANSKMDKQPRNGDYYKDGSQFNNAYDNQSPKKTLFRGKGMNARYEGKQCSAIIDFRIL